MKNLKLIYLIPALMVLVWGCGGEKAPQETTDSDIVEMSDSAMAAPAGINYCTYIIDDSIAALLYTTSGDYSTSITISGMPAPTGVNPMTDNSPILYSEADTNLDFSLMFKLKNLTLASGYATAKYIRNDEILVIQLEAIDGTSNESYHKLSGNVKDFYPEYNGTGINSVVAIIRHPLSKGGYDYSFSTNVLDVCQTYSTNPTTSNNFTLTSTRYDHGVLNTDAPHVYAQTNENRTTIKYLDLEIPIVPGYIIKTNSYSCVATNDGTNSKLTISVTVDSDSTQDKSLIYSFNDNINTIFSGIGNVEEIEIIVTNSSTNTVKRVKIRVQSSNNHGLIPVPALSGSNGR